MPKTIPVLPTTTYRDIADRLENLSIVFKALSNIELKDHGLYVDWNKHKKRALETIVNVNRYGIPDYIASHRSFPLFKESQRILVKNNICLEPGILAQPQKSVLDLLGAGPEEGKAKDVFDAAIDAFHKLDDDYYLSEKKVILKDLFYGNCVKNVSAFNNHKKLSYSTFFNSILDPLDDCLYGDLKKELHNNYKPHKKY